MNSCTKDATLNHRTSSNNLRTANGILSFNSQDDFASDLVLMNSMNQTELLVYQQEHGYQSYGVLCDSLYYEVAADSLNTDLVISKTNTYSDYLELVQDSENINEMVLMANFEQSPLYYLMNLDRMYIVDTMVYKVFKEGVLCANVSNTDNLKDIDLFSEADGMSGIISIGAGSGTGSGGSGSGGSGTSHDAGTYRSERATNGNNRTFASISILPITYAPAPQYTSYEFIRPYKRTMGIWYWCKRTISYSFNIAIDIHKINGTYNRVPFYKYGTNYAYSIKKNDVFFTPDLMDVSSIHYAGYDCYGDTPSTNPASFSIYTYNL